LSRRVVVTGVGLVSALGVGTEETWQAIRDGRPGVSRIEQFDPTGFACRIAGEVKNFDPARYVERKEIKKMGRFIQFGIAATEFALAQSGLQIDAHNAERVGVYIGSGIGGFEVIEREHKVLLEKGPSRISPFFIPATIINLASGHARRIGDVLADLATLAGVKIEIQIDPSRVRDTDIRQACGNPARARERLGWMPIIPWEQTLRDVLDDNRARLSTESG